MDVEFSPYGPCLWSLPFSACIGIVQVVLSVLEEIAAVGLLMTYDPLLECSAFVGNERREMSLPIINQSYLHLDNGYETTAGA